MLPRLQITLASPNDGVRTIAAGVHGTNLLEADLKDFNFERSQSVALGLKRHRDKFKKIASDEDRDANHFLKLGPALRIVRRVAESGDELIGKLGKQLENAVAELVTR